MGRVDVQSFLQYQNLLGYFNRDFSVLKPLSKRQCPASCLSVICQFPTGGQSYFPERLHSSFPYYPFLNSELTFCCCSDKFRSFMLHCKHFPLVLLLVYFFPVNSLRMGTNEVVEDIGWTWELCFFFSSFCLRLIKSLSSLNFFQSALFSKSYSFCSFLPNLTSFSNFLSYV